MQIECGFNSQNDLVHFGPTLNVMIGFDPSYRSDSGNNPNIPANTYPALVDTGATQSCIDSALATHLNLPIFDRRNVSGVHGSQTVNMHLAQIFVPELNLIEYGQFSGVHLTAGGQPHFALIGRTFLREIVMAYDGSTGSVRLSRIFNQNPLTS